MTINMFKGTNGEHVASMNCRIFVDPNPVYRNILLCTKPATKQLADMCSMNNQTYMGDAELLCNVLAMDGENYIQMQPLSLKFAGITFAANFPTIFPASVLEDAVQKGRDIVSIPVMAVHGDRSIPVKIFADLRVANPL